jgi:predicted membrane protein
MNIHGGAKPMKRSKYMFWAILFITIGVIILVQTVLGIDLPILRILFGVFLIYIGIKMIFGSFGIRLHGEGWKFTKHVTDNEIIFSEAKFKDSENNKHFTTVFGKSHLDTTDLNEATLQKTIHIDTVFGKTIVRTNPELPVIVRAAVVFGSVKLRGQSQNFIGEGTISTPNWSEAKPHLSLNVNTVFGEVDIQ